ncbi:MAG: thioredoxin [Acutalibacteraceae bacterium]|nr:thioredoxin [Acutalibacteraceae bacterium]
MEFEITKSNFNELIKNKEGLALIDFWAVWCGPCQMQAPVIEELAKEFNDVTIGKVNVDEQQELALEYGISSIPTIILFKNGKSVDTLIGYQSKESLINLIEKYR